MFVLIAQVLKHHQGVPLYLVVCTLLEWLKVL